MNLWPFGRAAERRHRSYVPDYAADARRFRALEDLAAQLAEAERGWHIYASASTGTLVAMPLWDPGKRVIITSPTPELLRSQMRQVEAEAIALQIVPVRRGGAGKPPMPLVLVAEATTRRVR